MTIVGVGWCSWCGRRMRAERRADGRVYLVAHEREDGTDCTGSREPAEERQPHPVDWMER